MSVAFQEEDIVYSFKPWKSTAIRTGIIAWGDIDAMREELFPAPVSLSTQQTGGFGIALPGKTWLRADSVEVKKVSDRVVGPLQHDGTVDTTQELATLAEFEYARVTITYMTPLYGTLNLDQMQVPIDGDPVIMLDHKWSCSSEFITIPPKYAKWLYDTTHPVPDDVKATMRLPIIEHQITWPYVINPPFTAIRNNVGKTNSAPRKFRTGSPAADTLLFLGAELSGQVLSDGTLGYQITYRFGERHTVRKTGTDLGWNGTYNPLLGDWDYLLVNGNPIFQQSSDNFVSLFQTSPTG